MEQACANIPGDVEEIDHNYRFAWVNKTPGIKRWLLEYNVTMTFISDSSSQRKNKTNKLMDINLLNSSIYANIINASVL